MTSTDETQATAAEQPEPKKGKDKKSKKDKRVIDEPFSPNDNHSFARPDPELETLVRMANDTGIGLSITLTVSGVVVTGQLIGIEAFWNGVADHMEANVQVLNKAGEPVAEDEGQSTGSAFADLYRTIASTYRKPEERDEDELDFPPRYIHLKDATLWSGDTRINAPFWRGRQSHVSGWSFGG